MPLRLTVIDGPDKGQHFRLPNEGAVLIGNSEKHANICLHDLFVARVHCEVAVAGGRVTVIDRQSPRGTLINGARIQQEELSPADVVRVGNSYLRLENCEHDDAQPIEAAPEPVADEGPPVLPVEKMSALAGRTLGHFELGRPLGQGYAGMTFRARDQKKDREVALKILAPEFPANDQEMQDFIRVMRRRFALTHPNLVTMLGTGKTGPYCWIESELIEGENAASMIEATRAGKRPSWRLAWIVARDIGLALDFAHRHHVVHGQVTPAKILIRDRDETAKLNGLMLRNSLEGSVLQQSILEAQLLKNLPFVPPEIMEGGQVDELSDQYCLGVVTFALATGRLPFCGDTPEETIRQVRENPPPKLKKFQKNIPDHMQAVVLNMLAKRPEERFPSLAAMTAELMAMNQDDTKG
jgi:serine/threonine protein kinase